MSLSNVAVQNARPDSKPFKMLDTGGLYLIVRPSGAKLWRYKYRIDGKENLFAIGEYYGDKRTGHVSLEAARRARDEARELVRGGTHPSHQRQNVLRKQLVVEQVANLREMVETGQAPFYTELASSLGLAVEEGRKTLHDLFSSGIAGWLYPRTDHIVSFAPFNNLPTHYRITIDGRQKWFGQ